MSETAVEITEEEAAELNEGLDALHSPEGELVEPDEADELEQEQGDEQQRQAQARNEDEIEKALKKLDAEALRHWNRIEEIMGADATALVPCELCSPRIPGYRWDRSPDEPTVAKVRVVIGMPDLSNFRPSATERVCDDCSGLGRVRTGSSVAKYETATCDACAGKGFVPSRPRLNADAPTDATPPETNGAAAEYEDGVQRDMFGTPETDPDYGKMPNMRSRPVDYWQTARV